MRTQRVDHLALFATLILITIGFAIGLGNHGPIPSMETRFAVVVQQMLRHHQWLVPEKNGLPYIEYPPFYYWMSMVFAKAGLPLLVAIRLPNLVAVWLFYGVLYRLAKHLVPQLPKWSLPAACVLAPAVLYNFFIAQTDGWLTLGAALSILGYIQCVDNRKDSGFPWMLWIGAAIAVFSKGPVGLVIVLLTIGSERLGAMAFGAISFRELTESLLKLKVLRGLFLALAPLAAWYLACGLFVSWDFVRASFVYNNITRFLAGVGGHDNPWWLYGETIWGDYFPWSLFMPLGLMVAIKHRKNFPSRLVLFWGVATILFFSVSTSKQSKYILPAAPAVLALGLIGLDRLVRHNQQLFRWIQGSWTVGLSVTFVVAVAFWLPFRHYDDGPSYAQLKGHLVASPGRVEMYGWPRALVLWQLGAPMPWYRDSRALYQAVTSGKLPAGSYLLVPRSDLGKYGARGPRTLTPAPKPPYFKYVMFLKSKGGFEVYRVLPSALKAPVPVTPNPPKQHWWNRFDTD